MGAEVKTTLRLGRRTFAGTAHLETGELRFRGEATLRIPLASVREVAVKNGALQVTHAHGVAVLDLGEAAAKWADRIRSPGSLADKLGVKPGMQIAVLGVDDAEILADLVSRGAELSTGKVATGTPTKVVRFSDTDTAEKLVIPRAER